MIYRKIQPLKNYCPYQKFHREKVAFQFSRREKPQSYSQQKQHSPVCHGTRPSSSVIASRILPRKGCYEKVNSHTYCSQSGVELATEITVCLRAATDSLLLSTELTFHKNPKLSRLWLARFSLTVCPTARGPPSAPALTFFSLIKVVGFN